MYYTILYIPYIRGMLQYNTHYIQEVLYNTIHIYRMYYTILYTHHIGTILYTPSSIEGNVLGKKIVYAYSRIVTYRIYTNMCCIITWECP